MRTRGQGWQGGRTDVGLVHVGVKERDRGLVGLVLESGTKERTDQSQSVWAWIVGSTLTLAVKHGTHVMIWSMGVIPVPPAIIDR